MHIAGGPGGVTHLVRHPDDIWQPRSPAIPLMRTDSLAERKGFELPVPPGRGGTAGVSGSTNPGQL